MMRTNAWRLSGFVRAIGCAAAAGVCLVAIGGCPIGGNVIPCTNAATELLAAADKAKTAAEACDFDAGGPCPDLCDAIADAEDALNRLVDRNCAAGLLADLGVDLDQIQADVEEVREEALAKIGCD